LRLSTTILNGVICKAILTFGLLMTFTLGQDHSKSNRLHKTDRQTDRQTHRWKHNLLGGVKNYPSDSDKVLTELKQIGAVERVFLRYNTASVAVQGHFITVVQDRSLLQGEMHYLIW